MPRSQDSQPGIFDAVALHWRDMAVHRGSLGATTGLLRSLWEFARDSTPSRLKRRFGDADYDWDHRVNTTSGAVGWRDRLLGVLHSQYQPTEPVIFREMLDTLHQHSNLNFEDFTFVDLGSGKGRTLLMAADYPFKRIIGVELLPTLHQIAQQNIADYKAESQKSFALESICADASTFSPPEGALLIYLFNPFPETILRQVAANIRKSLKMNPRPLFVVFHNPEHEHVLEDMLEHSRLAGTHQYSMFQVNPS
jgi:16S rRNA G966 N2-methylase RsmD